MLLLGEAVVFIYRYVEGDAEAGVKVNGWAMTALLERMCEYTKLKQCFRCGGLSSVVEHCWRQIAAWSFIGKLSTLSSPSIDIAK